MKSRVWVVLGMMVLVAVVGAGAFYGGLRYEQSRAESLRAAFLAGRPGAGAENGFPGGDGFPGGGFFGGGGGNGGQNGGRVAGTVKTVEGNTVQISTPQNVTTVTLTDRTVISKLIAGALSDLRPGDTVTVRGARDSAGNVTADSIQILTEPGQ